MVLPITYSLHQSVHFWNALRVPFVNRTKTTNASSPVRDGANTNLLQNYLHCTEAIFLFEVSQIFTLLKHRWWSPGLLRPEVFWLCANVYISFGECWLWLTNPPHLTVYKTSTSYRSSFQSWGWRRYVTPKRWHTAKSLHVMCVSVVRISNSTNWNMFQI